MSKILVCDDDKEIVEAIDIYLSQEGYEVLKAYDGEEALKVLGKEKIDLLVIDVMMPKLDGIRATLKIREANNMPIIILSAKSEDADKILGLNVGADDYVTKPFDIKEVAARVEVQIRRMGGETKDKAPKELQYQGLVLDKEGFRVIVEGRELAKITKQEFAILELLLKHPKKVFSKEEIFEYAWDEPYMGETKTLDVHISNIRKKIKEVSEKEYIETVWGIGYRLHP